MPDTETNPAVVHQSDEELAARIKSGSADAIHLFEQLYHRHARMLSAFVSARVGRAECQDTAQDVWLKVWTHTGTGFSGGNFRAWLYQIARNTIKDRHRKRELESGPDSDVPASADGPLEGLLDRERFEIFRGCFSILTRQESQVLRALFAGKPYEEVCELCNINANIAYKTASSGKSIFALKDCVKQKLS